MFTQSFFAALLAASTAVALPPPAPARGVKAPQCPIVFEGRVPVGTPSTFFDTSNALFNPDYVKGNDLTWSSILKFPAGTPSRFDGANHTAVEVTISDKSIFQKQLGFRRAGLQFSKDAPDGEGGKGIKTLHFSVKQDPARPLNLTHEYLNVWHESADYSHNQFQFTTGTLIDNKSAKKDSFKVQDAAGKILWSIPISPRDWQNFAFNLDYVSNKLTIYYSKANEKLQRVAGPLTTDLSGGGQFQMGILKKPTGTSDVVNGGYQSSNLNEGQIYGGLFLEDSMDGCISL
jgi:hypothetical protein